jgi:hypothetical protein
VRSDAETVEQYLDQLPEHRREAIRTVRGAILESLASGYEEVMAWGMITYQVPLSIESETYNGKPLVYASLASQKNYMAVYLMSLYIVPGAADAFEARYRATGKRYDAGKSCVRFRTLDALPLDLVGEAIASVGVEQFVEKVRQGRKRPV